MTSHVMPTAERRVRVDLAERSYDILIGPGLIAARPGGRFPAQGPEDGGHHDENVGPATSNRL